MLRLAIAFGLVLSACGGRSTAPAWPKPSPAEDDGGESIAPRSKNLVAIEASEDDTPYTPEEDDDEPSTDDTTSSSTDTTESSDESDADKADEPIQTEDIVIEIEDD